MIISALLRGRILVRVLCAGAAGLIVAVAFIAFEDHGQSGKQAGLATNHGVPTGAARHAMWAAQRQRDQLASLQAKLQRARSRTAFRALNARQALRLGRATNHAVLLDRTPRPLAGARKHGMVVARYASQYAAVLRPRAGTRVGQPGVMAISTLPLRSRDASGHLRLVNLVPEKVGSAWVPDNARVKVSFGDRAGDGFRVSERGISLVPLDVSDRAGQVSGDSVFFANTATDADHIERVTPAGAESLVQLRSSASPSRFRYRIDLPAGGTLSKQADGSISVSVDGHPAGSITTPIAWDADHQSIPVTTTLRGDILTLDVAHRGRDIRYPAMLDPTYVDALGYGWYRNANNYTSTAYWAYDTTQPSLMGGLFGNYGNPALGQTNGLYSISRGNQYFPAGSYGFWRFTAPGTTAIVEAEWTHLSHIAAVGAGAAPCLDYGITRNNATAWVAGSPGSICANVASTYAMSCSDCNDTDGYTYDASIKGAQWGTQVYGATISNISDYLGESTVYLADVDDPVITTSPAGGWTTNPAQTVTASAVDEGLGVQSIRFSTPTDNGPQTNNAGCLISGPCPRTMPTTAYAVPGLADGVTNVTVRARDAANWSSVGTNRVPVSGFHEPTATIPIKLDRTPPTITPSGTLWDARNAFVGPTQNLTLDVTATDGDLSSLAAQRSGATSLAATLDGQPMTNGSAAAACTRPEGSCPLTIHATLSAAQIQALDDTIAHTVQINASDALGQPTPTVSFTFRVDSISPATFSDGALTRLSGRTLSEDSYRLRVEARDNQPNQLEMNDTDDVVPPVIETPGAGLRDLIIRLDGQMVSTTATGCFDDPQCEDARIWQWDTTTAVNGMHTVSITATDKAGNQNVDAFEVDLERVADQPARTDTTVRRTILGAGAGDRTGTSATAVGDINGDGYADYAVGSPNATPSGRTAAGTTSVVLGSATTSAIDLSNPGPGVRTISGPGANQYCGTSVAAAGDINGDGLADLLVGCPGLDTRLGALTATGRVYVIFGRTDPQDIDLANIGTAGFVITGPTDTLNLGLPALTSRPSVFGEHLQSAAPDQTSKDVNDDGLDDIVIGDSAVGRGTQSSTGATYVIYGTTNTGTIDATALGTAGYVIRGDVTDSMSGYSAAIVGDVNGDTFADIAIGAPGKTPTTGGRAYIVDSAPYDTNGARTNADVDLGTSGQVVTLTSGGSADRFGAGVSAVGDTNLDDSPDVGIATSSGAYVLRTIPTTSRQITVDDGYRITGPTNTPSALSTAVPVAPISAAGDLDGDERADLIIGYPDTTDAISARAYTIRSPEGSRTINVAALPGQRGAAINTGTQADRAGAAISANSYQGTTPVSENAQAAIGAPDAAADATRPGAGRAYVVSEPTPSGPGVDSPPVPSAAQSTGFATRAAAGTFAPSEPFRVNVPGLFNILVQDSINTRWASVRNDLQFFVIGSAADNQNFYVDYQKLTNGVASGTNKRLLYLHGRLGGAVNRCGWVLGDNAPGDGQPFPGGQSPRSPCGAEKRLSPRVFASLVNCDACADGSPTVLRRRDGGPLPDTIPIYRNVHPGTHEGKFSPDGTIPTHIGAATVRVNWRYITKSGQFVMVRATSTNANLFGNNKWAFIERKYLPHTAGVGGLCDNTAGTAPHVIPAGGPDEPSEFLNYTSEPAQDLARQPTRMDWPRVCSRRKYNVPDGP